ncbi:hypothetical protein Scep_023893 [Stephania cephalantha]|uniref:Uncharacterized protein n=1 Tax=Stephania cephalantha TaxID=152367 RepID=A0AAP0F2L8_9MAGN
MINDGMYQEIAKTNAEAIHGLRPKINIWNNDDQISEVYEGYGCVDNLLILSEETMMEPEIKVNEIEKLKIIRIKIADEERDIRIIEGGEIVRWEEEDGREMISPAKSQPGDLHSSHHKKADDESRVFRFECDYDLILNGWNENPKEAVPASLDSPRFRLSTAVEVEWQQWSTTTKGRRGLHYEASNVSRAHCRMAVSTGRFVKANQAIARARFRFLGLEKEPCKLLTSYQIR